MGRALPTASRELPRRRPAVRFEFLIGMRYLRARRRERFVSLIAIISLAGVTLGTFALTVALSVMSGFQEDLRARLLAFTPQVTMRSATTAAFGIRRRCEDESPRCRESKRPRRIVTSQVMAVSSNAAGAPGLRCRAEFCAE